MNFDTVLLSAVVDQLNKSILGARIDKVSQPEPLELIIGFYKDNSHKDLLISAYPESSRVHLIKKRGRPNPLTAPAFCMLLRKYLEGAFVEEISLPLGFSERVMRLRARPNSQSEPVDLWIEVMGRQSNVILTSSAGLILGAIKRVTSAMSRLREVRTGIVYMPPPKQLGYKRDPMDALSGAGLSEDVFNNSEDAERWLTTTFRGIGTLLAKEVVLRCNDKPLNGENLWYALNEILNLVRTAEYLPIVYRKPTGQMLGAYAFPLRSLPLTLQTEALTISDALEFAFGEAIKEDTAAKERTALLAALRKAHRAAEKQMLDVQEGLVNADGSDYFRESGELLLANLSAIKPGAPEAVVDDLFSTTPGTKRMIPLDVSQSINENAQRYFRKFQKSRDSREALEARQASLSTTIAELESALTDAEIAATAPEISIIAERLGSRIATAQYASAGKVQEASPYEGHKIKTYRSPDGWEILVGENSTSNDFLTTKIASPSDIWLHARAVPSAHAVVRSQNRPASVSSAALRIAAEQVAKRSSAKHARLVSVDYTLKKYVRKPRGSAPGQVTYTNEKTLDVLSGTDD